MGSSIQVNHLDEDNDEDNEDNNWFMRGQLDGSFPNIYQD